MGDNLGSPYGYSLRRNDTCAVDEEDCGVTWSSSHICCPGKTKCVASKDAPGICCPSTANCATLLDELCADPTADLYYADETEGFFCCTEGTLGFRGASNNFGGCAKQEDVDDFGVKVKTMRAIVQTARSTSSSSNTATATTASKNANTDTSHSNTGAIAGGVVGGIAGVVILIALVWCLLRRRKKQAQDTQPVPVSELSDGNRITELSDGNRITELSDGNRITELSGQSISELPGSEKQKLPPAELAS